MMKDTLGTLDTGRETDGAAVSTGSPLEDFISGLPVRSTPEEVDAVQVFARRLVEDYGYIKAQVRTC